MGDIRIRGTSHPVDVSPTGFDKGQKKTEKFGNIFGNLGIAKSTENTKLCLKEGVVVKKRLDERTLEDLTANPPFGGKTIGPLALIFF